MKELSEEEKYIRKAALLKKALADADKMDAADVEKTQQSRSLRIDGQLDRGAFCSCVKPWT